MEATAYAEQRIIGTYGRLTIEYRRTTFTWTVTVYQGTLRIDELCQVFSAGLPAYREAQRIATAAYAGESVEQIVAAKPSELVLAAVKSIVDAVPEGERRQVPATMPGAHLADITEAQARAIRHASRNDGRVYACRDFPRPVLRSLARKGHGVLNYQPGLGRRKVIESLTLSGRGWDEANRQPVSA